MNYFIIAEKETDCNLSFPDQLSSFFEQIGGFEEKSEVVQTSQILGIDLSAFQNFDYEGSEPDEEKKFWTDCNLFLSITKEFIDKIEAHPTFHEKVKHDSDMEKRGEQMNRIFNSTSPESIIGFLQEQQKDEQYGFPPDHGYLKEGRLLNDLRAFQKTVECLMGAGHQKMKLLYM